MARVRADETARRLTAMAAALAIAVGMLAALAVAAPPEPASAAPGSPGTPSAPTEVFRETFEGGQGATATRLATFVGVAGQTHTADPFWLREDQCNGVLLRYQGTVFPPTSPEGGFCVDGDQTNTRNNSRRLADVLGQVDAGVVGSTSTATPVNGSTAATQANHAVAAFTSDQNGPNGAIEFQTSPLALTVSGTRFYTTSVDVAEVSCAFFNGSNNSRLRFSLKVGATEYPLTSAAPIRACTDPRARYYTSPDLPGGWVNAGGYAAAGRFTASAAQLLTAAQLNGVQVVIRNDIGAQAGNDAAYDNVRILDATPQLDKSFSPAQVGVGGTSTLTLTVTNTSELAAKIGWGFTDALPAGLVVKSPANVGGTCAASVAATAGSGSIAVSGGRLETGQASCTITVDVTSTAAGTYQNCAANILNPIGVNAPACAAVEFTAQSFRCTAGVVYGLNSTGAILAIDTATGASTQEALFPAGATAALDGLALTADGRFAYAVTRSGTKTVFRYDTTTGTATALGMIPEAAGFDLVMGAFDPVNGLYYAGGVSGGQYLIVAFDPATGTSRGVQFRLAAPAGVTLDGDLAFDSSARAYILMSAGDGVAAHNPLVVVDVPPTDGSLVASRLLANPAPAAARFQGVAFGGDGYLYAQYAAATRMLVKVDPNSGAAAASTPILDPGGAANTLVGDLASCASVSTLTLQKDLEGRYAAGDQFALAITGNGTASGNTGTTSGSSSGLQTAASATAGAVLAVPGRTYAIAETADGGADLARYRADWVCRDEATGAVVAQGAGTAGTVAIPAGPSGIHVACVFTNVPIPTWTIAKQAFRGAVALATGATVHPGEELTYRVTATSTSDAALDGVTLTDDLSGVLDDATFVSGSAQLVVGAASPVPIADPAADRLTAGPFVLPGRAVAVLTYRVRVADDAWSATLTNTVTGTAGTPALPDPPQPCAAACTTTQVTSTPVQIQKVGEASDGEIVPMDGSSWTIWDAASGGTALVDPVPAATSGGAAVVGLFRDASLGAGTYWLQETRALDGFALLAERVPFTIDADGGVALGAGAGANVAVVDVDGIRTIRVEDVPALALPDAGGPGTGRITLLGAALLAVGCIGGVVGTVLRNRGLRVRRR